VSSVGTITGFGSVFINGDRFETDDQTVVSVEGEDDVTGDTSGLRLGMKVTVKGTESQGTRTAQSVDYDDDLKGAAENVTPNASNPEIGTFTVAGQTVTVDVNTVFDDDVGNNDRITGIDIRDLDPSNFAGNTPIVVEVSGYPTTDGFLATRVDRVNIASTDLGQSSVDGDEIEVKGVVDDVASDGSSITINGTVFLVNASTFFEAGLAADSDLIGRFVEIKADIDGGGAFVAVRVEREDDLSDFSDDDEFEIEGILTAVDTSADPDEIQINGLSLRVDDASSLVSRAGKRVELKGSFDGNGVLVLSLIKLEVENSIRVEDQIASVDINAQTITPRLGLVITPTGDSRIEDDVQDGGDTLSVADFLARLSASDFIEARGFPEDGGDITWTRVEREDNDDSDCRLQGPVDADSIQDPEFSIQGITIDTTGLGFGGFEDENDLDIGRTAFFSRLQAGDVVQAESDDAGLGCSDGRLATESTGEVSFELLDDVFGANDTPDPGSGNNGDPNDNEISGAIANLDTANNSFSINGRSIQVTDDTLIDSSIVEDARGVELGPDDLRLGDIPETLGDLFANGDIVKVTLDGDNAVLIEGLD
jgi:hypothetical protein